jgi:hypothetical protein
LAGLASYIKFVTILVLLIKLGLEFTIMLLTLLSHVSLISCLSDFTLGSKVIFGSLILEGSKMKSLLIESSKTNG